eukprot:747012_1
MLIDDINTCYATNPCIKIAGIDPWQDFSDIYIEKEFDTSTWDDIKFNIESATVSIDNSNEYCFIETLCNNNNPQRIPFHYGKLEPLTHRSDCFTINTISCNTLQLRIGGYLSGKGDSISVTQILYQYTVTPTQAPTADPTSAPSIAPSIIPSFAPTTPPSNNPSISPSKYPTPSPTDIPTNNPSINPTTPSPTDPGELICDDIISGEYNGIALSFTVRINYEGDLTFDATNSSFTPTSIIGTYYNNTIIDMDNNNDAILTLYNLPFGYYKFILDGGAITSTFHIQISCQSDNPTPAPTFDPASVGLLLGFIDGDMVGFIDGLNEGALVIITTDHNNDGIISIYDVIIGNYIFTITR